MVFLTIVIFLAAIAVVGYGFFIVICGLISDICAIFDNASKGNNEKIKGKELAKHIGLLFVDIFGLIAIILGTGKMFSWR